MRYKFSLAYYIDPATATATPENPHVITFEERDLDGEQPLHQWYRPNSSDEIPTIQPHNATTKPNRKVNWSEDTKPQSANQSNKSADFQLGMDLMYRDGASNSVPVVYEGAISDGTLHTARFAEGSKLVVHNSYLQLLDQPDFSNMPKTPLDYRNEVGTCIFSEEAQDLARTSALSLLQQELMSWNNRLYHLPYRILF